MEQLRGTRVVPRVNIRRSLGSLPFFTRARPVSSSRRYTESSGFATDRGVALDCLTAACETVRTDTKRCAAGARITAGRETIRQAATTDGETVTILVARSSKISSADNSVVLEKKDPDSHSELKFKKRNRGRGEKASLGVEISKEKRGGGEKRRLLDVDYLVTGCKNSHRDISRYQRRYETPHFYLKM